MFSKKLTNKYKEKLQIFPYTCIIKFFGRSIEFKALIIHLYDAQENNLICRPPRFQPSVTLGEASHL